jgi:hypothetical protein
VLMHTAQGLFVPVMLQGSADAFPVRVSIRVCYDDIEVDPSLAAEENSTAMWLGLCPAAFVASFCFGSSVCLFTQPSVIGCLSVCELEDGFVCLLVEATKPACVCVCFGRMQEVVGCEELPGVGTRLSVDVPPLTLEQDSACADGSFAALVVGAETYMDPLRLQLCRADAKDMGELLHRKGYTVMRLLDPTASQLHRAFSRFLARLRPDSTAVLYFSGHGLQVGGVNFMVPVDAVEKGTALHTILCVGRFLLASQEHRVSRSTR